MTTSHFCSDVKFKCNRHEDNWTYTSKLSFEFSGELHFRFTKEELLQVTSPLVGCFGPIPISFTRVLSATQETVGFEHVDAHVTDVMITWIGSVMQKTCRELVEEAREVKKSNRVATRNIEDLGDGSQFGVFWLEKTEMFLFQVPAFLFFKVEWGSQPLWVNYEAVK